MLAIHWSPVSNTKRILKNGIKKSKNGLYCFPLTGNKIIDKWWVAFFNRSKARPFKNYNGIIFKINKDDLPAYLGPWGGATNRDNFDKPIITIAGLKAELNNTMLFRIGEYILHKNGRIQTSADLEQDFIKVAVEEINGNKKLRNEYFGNIDLKAFAFEDYQLVLTQSIVPERIIKVISDGQQTGRVRRKIKLSKELKDE